MEIFMFFCCCNFTCKDLSDSSYFKAGAIESEAEKGSKNLRVSLDDYSSNVQFGISVFTV